MNGYLGWMTVKKMRDRHKAWKRKKRYRSSPLIHDYDEFKCLRNEATA